VEEIVMKKPKTVVDLLTVVDTCIEAFEAQARLLESCDKGLMKKKQNDWEVNTTDQADRKDHGYRRNHQQLSLDQKENRSFRRPDDAEKWCEIHHTSRHDLEECKTFLYRKKIPPPPAQVAQEPRRGEHRRAHPPNNDEQIGEINVIFGGNIPIASKTQGKKLEWEINLAQRIEPGRMMRWFDVGISFIPQDHPDIELFDKNLSFVIKLPIGRHKVAKILIDNGALLNLIMRKTFIEMGLNLKDLTPPHMICFTGSSQDSRPHLSDASNWRCPVEQETTSTRRC
jgi:hypothetical protein